ncbi:hypothetical protein [Pseudonocardia sp. MH-G8]|uniref:hypothetical protein n=1 Tax=Pseudonocardia sp. MH-G8 TaxID=1854588 RepID=UPI000BA08078|nr:hypothetical protein [Pseudonocardia sp. MH-G8]OZM81151.1 hypothetical protein CFP66_17375 [Pseudonocardia sp. MH-G8]
MIESPPVAEDHDPLPHDVAEYRGPGASAVPALARAVRAYGLTDLDEITPVVIAETGLSDTTVWKAWLALLDLDRLALVGPGHPRPGRHRDAHVWVDEP